jgi:hypothetical protein
MRRRLYAGLLALLAAISLVSCTDYNAANTLQGISYTKNPSSDYTVYIQENDVLTPYLALDDNYNGNVLLVRKFVFHELIAYNTSTSQGSGSGYYPACNADIYLNTAFIGVLPASLQDKIIDSNINVATMDGVKSGGGDKTTENINRRIFLLSAMEMGIKSNLNSAEGKTLAYYKSGKNSFIETYENGVAEAYWLRSAYHWDDIQAWSIGSDGKYGGSLVSFSYGIRPAFCLNRDTKIEKSTLDGKEIFILSE